MALSFSLIRRSSPVVAVGPPALLPVDAVAAFESAVASLEPYERMMREGADLHTLMPHADEALRTLRTLSFEPAFRISIRALAELQELRDAGRGEAFVNALLQQVRQVYRIQPRLEIVDHELGAAAARRLADLDQVAGARITPALFAPAMELEPPWALGGSDIPAWATHFELLTMAGRRIRLKLNEAGEVVLDRSVWPLLRHSPRLAVSPARAVVSYHDGFWLRAERDPVGIEGELLDDRRSGPTDLGVDLDDGDLIDLGPLGVVFQLSPDAPPLERNRRWLGQARSLERILEVLGGRTTPEAVPVVEFMEGSGPFDRISRAGRLAEAVDRVFQRMEQILLSEYGKGREARDPDEAVYEEERPSKPGHYTFPPAEIVRRVAALRSQHLPFVPDEATALGLMEEMIGDVSSRRSFPSLVGKLRASFLWPEPLVEDLRTHLAGDGPVRWHDFPDAFGLAQKLRRLALAAGRPLVEPLPQSMADPPSAEEEAILTGVGLDAVEFFGAPWRPLVDIPGPVHDTVSLFRARPTDIVVKEGDLDRLTGRLVTSVERGPAPASHRRYADLEPQGGVLVPPSADLSGSPFKAGARGPWTVNLLKGINDAGYTPIAHGAFLVHGHLPQTDPFGAALYLSLADDVPAADIWLALYREVYEPLAGPTAAAATAAATRAATAPIAPVRPLQFVFPGDHSRFVRDGSTAVFFRAVDQSAVYDEVHGFHLRHPAFFRPAIPRFTAPVRGWSGDVMPGVGFGQQPSLGLVGFQQHRDGTLRKAVQVARLLNARGHKVGWSEFEQLVVYFFRHSNVDPARPAFNTPVGSDPHPFAFMMENTPSS